MRILNDKELKAFIIEFINKKEKESENKDYIEYSYYELNKRNIPLELLSKLADFYNTSVDYLIYRTDEFKPYEKPEKKEYN